MISSRPDDEISEKSSGLKSQIKFSNPIFPSIDEPSPTIVGYLLPVVCGHTGHPSVNESKILE